MMRKLGSYGGDLWDFMLDTCGYEIMEFRKSHPRKAQYVGIYTRQDFELLWEGREHRCPYWDDKIWPEIEHEVERGNRNNPKVKRQCAEWHFCDESTDDGSTTDAGSGSPGAPEYDTGDGIQALSIAEVDFDSTSSNGELSYAPHQVNSEDSNSGQNHEMVSDDLGPGIWPGIENCGSASESPESTDDYHCEVSASQNDELFDNPWSEY